MRYDSICNINEPTVTFHLHPTYAEKVYDSCKDTEMSGGFAVRQLYPTYNEFFTMISDMNPILPLTFNISESGYNKSVDKLHNCTEFCSCQTCQLSCPEFESEDPTFPNVLLFGASVNIITSFTIPVFMILYSLVALGVLCYFCSGLG